MLKEEFIDLVRGRYDETDPWLPYETKEDNLEVILDGITPENWAIIEKIYTWSSIDPSESQVADLYLMFGMRIFKLLLPDAENEIAEDEKYSTLMREIQDGEVRLSKLRAEKDQILENFAMRRERV